MLLTLFQGHRLGDVAHPDYNCSIDQQSNELRPKSKNKDVTLIEKATTDTARAGAGYQKTGDLVTLPYNEETFYRTKNMQQELKELRQFYYQTGQEK